MRSIRLRLLGFAGLLAIMVLLAGVPAALITIGATPSPQQLPTWDRVWGALTQPDDGHLLLAVIAVVAWAAWLFIAASVVLEIAFRLRGVSAPRLPGLAVPQGLARGLVSVAALLFTALPLGATASAAPPTPPPVTATVAPSSPTHTVTAPSNPATAPTGTSRHTDKHHHTTTHTVRSGETLWAIAEQHLGDGARYREIAQLNYGHRQPDGGKLTGTHWIRPGWELTVPTTNDSGGSKPAQQQSYTVQPGDTLWDIADDELGTGSRYVEIVAASSGIEQPGGHHLTDPDEISAGWRLRIPTHHEQAGDNKSNSRPRTSPRPPATSTPPATPPVSTPPLQPSSPNASPAQPSASTTPSATRPSTSAAPASEQPAPAQPGSTAAADDDASAEWVVRTAAGVGAVLAAGVLGLVTTRRRGQQRRRRPGRTLPMPAPAAAKVEQDLRATADPLSVEAVDVALRTLAHSCSRTGDPLPVVRAARLTADQFDLYLAEPAELPDPWTGTADVTVWSLDAASAATLDAATVTDVPAPYPALVTIGHDLEGGHVFLDLEHLGALNITGDPERTQEVIAAVAVELATSQWADDLQITVVGAYPELEDALQTGRIRYLPAVGHVLDELANRAELDRAALASGHAQDLQHARVTGAAPDAWTPEIVLLAGPITARQRRQLETLVDQLPRVAIAAITTGIAVGEWTLDLADPGSDLAVLSPIGLQLQPQRIDQTTYKSILEMVALTDVDDDASPGDEATEPTLADIDQVTARRAYPDNTNTPRDDNGPQRPQPADTLPAAAAAPRLPSVDDAAPMHADAGVDRPAVPTDLGEDTETEAVQAVGADSAAANTEHDTDDDGDADTAVPMAEPEPPTPVIRLLGPVDLLHAGGRVEPNKRNSLLELAAYLALHPGATHKAIDDAVWPNRKSEENLNTRNTATSKLRSWMGKSPAGDDYLPRHQSGSGYGFLPAVKTDWQLWQDLLPNGPTRAATEHLEQALKLIRGRPFDGVHPRRYAWAEPARQRMISDIVDASYELARRRLMQGRWRAAEEAIVIGLAIEPVLERLWRLRILAAHESRNTAATKEAIDRLLAITDELGGDLETETENLLTAMQDPDRELDMAGAL
ncbi:LysM peptidoglycan-binding domain-containing protein [Microlunatus lacustris]